MRITVSVLSPPRMKQTSLEKLLGISLPVHVRVSNFFSFTEKPRGIFFLPFPSPASISCETSPASRTSIPSVRRKYCNAPAKISTTRKACVRITPTPRSVKRARRKTDAEIFSTANAPTPRRQSEESSRRKGNPSFQNTWPAQRKHRQTAPQECREK